MYINQQIVEQTLPKDGRIFSAVFEKTDGTKRKIVARLGVRRYVNGVGLRYNPIERAMIVVFDMQLKQYRLMNISKISQLRVNKKDFSASPGCS